MHFSDQFDGSAGHLVFAVYDQTALLASIRISVLFDQRSVSPSTLAFPDEIGVLVQDGAVIDPNRFVVDRLAAERFPDLHLLVLTVPFPAARYFGAAHVLASLRPEHRAFYRRTLRCKEVASPRRHHGLTAELCLMRVSFPGENVAVKLKNPFFGFECEYHCELAAAVQALV